MVTNDIVMTPADALDILAAKLGVQERDWYGVVTALAALPADADGRLLYPGREAYFYCIHQGGAGVPEITHGRVVSLHGATVEVACGIRGFLNLPLHTAHATEAAAHAAYREVKP